MGIPGTPNCARKGSWRDFGGPIWMSFPFTAPWVFRWYRPFPRVAGHIDASYDQITLWSNHDICMNMCKTDSVWTKSRGGTEYTKHFNPKLLIGHVLTIRNTWMLCLWSLRRQTQLLDQWLSSVLVQTMFRKCEKLPGHPQRSIIICLLSIRPTRLCVPREKVKCVP